MCKRIQVLGDSISVGYGLRDNEPSFVTLLESHPELSIDTFALCGQTTFDLIQNIKLKQSVFYDTSIILIGTNGSVTSHEVATLISEVRKTSNNIIICTVPIITVNNDVIRNVARKYQVTLADINIDWKSEYFLQDLIHPNKEGHYYIYKKLLDLLIQK